MSVPIDDFHPSRTERFTFALGWFWGPDSRFGSLDGVLRTEVGYAGGRTTAPTYHDLADHAEAVDLVFDPEQISYEQLLDQYWKGFVPSSGRSSQYRSALFCHNEAQLTLAQQGAEREGYGQRQIPEISMGASFYAAEDYHQKWRLRRQKLIFADLQENYATEAALLASTAAAKLNAYVAGQGSALQIERDLHQLGLSDAGKESLTALAKHRRS